MTASTDEEDGDLARGGRRRRRRRTQPQAAAAAKEEVGKEGMTSLERLIRTHPIWFLPAVDSTEEAAELLAGKEAGVS